MSQATISMFPFTNVWALLGVVFVIANIIALLVIIIPIVNDEYGKKRTKSKKEPETGLLIDIAITILLICLLIIILTMSFFIIGNQLSDAVIDCGNCTTALGRFG